MNDRQRARCQDQAAIRGTREGRDAALDLGRVAQVNRTYIHPERRRHGLDYAELASPGGLRRIADDARPAHTRRDLFE
jgi:hypothetical protein